MIDIHYQHHTIPFFLLELYIHLYLFPPRYNPSSHPHAVTLQLSSPAAPFSSLLHATAHKCDIPTHFLNGPPALLRLCQLSSARSPSPFPRLILKLWGSQPSVSIYLLLLSLKQTIGGMDKDMGCSKARKHTYEKIRVGCVNILSWCLIPTTMGLLLQDKRACCHVVSLFQMST